MFLLSEERHPNDTPRIVGWVGTKCYLEPKNILWNKGSQGRRGGWESLNLYFPFVGDRNVFHVTVRLRVLTVVSSRSTPVTTLW